MVVFVNQPLLGRGHVDELRHETERKWFSVLDGASFDQVSNRIVHARDNPADTNLVDLEPLELRNGNDFADPTLRHARETAAQRLTPSF